MNNLIIQQLQYRTRRKKKINSIYLLAYILKRGINLNISLRWEVLVTPPYPGFLFRSRNWTQDAQTLIFLGAPRAAETRKIYSQPKRRCAHIDLCNSRRPGGCDESTARMVADCANCAQVMVHPRRKSPLSIALSAVVWVRSRLTFSMATGPGRGRIHLLNTDFRCPPTGRPVKLLALKAVMESFIFDDFYLWDADWLIHCSVHWGHLHAPLATGKTRNEFLYLVMTSGVVMVSFCIKPNGTVDPFEHWLLNTRGKSALCRFWHGNHRHSYIRACQLLTPIRRVLFYRYVASKKIGNASTARTRRWRSLRTCF